jgi:Glucose / Sorbosone dehydrogenase
MPPINNPGATHVSEVRPGDPAGQPARPSAQCDGDIGLSHARDSSMVAAALSRQAGHRGALAGQMVVRLSLDDNTVLGEWWLLEGELDRIRDIRQGPDGFLYVLTDDPEGYLYRLVPGTDVARQGRPRTRL